jgi:predicted nucleic acid-binding protein
LTFLLDTNVVSEWVKPRPDLGLVAWLAELGEEKAHLSVVTFAELRFGIRRLGPGKRRERLWDWLHDELPGRFDGRILPVDGAVAFAWGDVSAECAAAGRPIEAMDALIAATARVHALELVTRNVKDFEPTGIAIRNPWSGPG